MKKRIMIALLMSATMLVSCSQAEVEETVKEETTTTTTAEETTEETTEETAAPAESEEQEPVADLITGGGDQYNTFMDKIDEIEAQDPGGYRYAFSIEYDNAQEGYFYTLAVIHGDDNIKYVILDGEIEEYTEGEVNDFECESALYYEQIRQLPCLISTSGLTHYELSDGIADYHAPTVDLDEPADGTYFGQLVGVTENGSSLLMVIGTPVSFDRDEILALEVGDPIGYNDLTIEEIFVNEETGYVSVTLGDPRLILSACDEADPSRLYLCGDSDAWILEDAFIAEVPVSSSCVVESTAANFFDMSGYDDMEPTGNPLMDSEYAYAMGLNEWNPSRYADNNGWVLPYGVIEPVEITNGEVTRIFIGFR